ncbi:MAG: acyltransferase [Dokdonella sp.]
MSQVSGAVQVRQLTRHTVPRLRHIDALRAIAALLVVWLHVTQVYVKVDGDTAIGGRWLYDVAQNFDFGRIGVITFFLVSGFVIPFSMRPSQGAPIGSFLIKRFFRIYPVYWLSIPMGAFATYWLWGQPFGVRDLLINLTLLQDLVGAQAAQGVYWTLLVEIGFYLLCVALFLTGNLFNPIRIGLLAVFFGLVHSLAISSLWLGKPLMGLTPSFWCLHLSLMLCGTLYRYCMATPTPTPGLANARKLLACLLVYYLVVFPAGAIWVHGLFHNYAVSGALGLMLFVVGISVVRIKTAVTDRLGAISYSIYLFHLVVYYPIFWWLQRQPVASWWRSQHLGVYLIVNTILTIALAALIHRFVEKPCIRLGHRYADKWTLRARADERGDGASTVTSVAVSEPVARLFD